MTGALVIEARRETLSDEQDWGWQAYSSARLVSRQPCANGFYEIHATLHSGDYNHAKGTQRADACAHSLHRLSHL